MAEAFGFFDSQPAGYAQGRGLKTPPFLWRDGKAEPFPPGTHKNVRLRAARGDCAAGFWETGSKRGAVCWRTIDGALALVDLHPDRFASSYAMGCGGGAQVGVGEPAVKKGAKSAEVGIVWRGSKTNPTILTLDGDEVSLAGTDGTAHVGAVGKLRAAMWRDDGASAVLLGPSGRGTAAVGVGDGEQVGEVWIGVGPRAVMWRGSEASMTDLHPTGFETSRALACAGGFQVGFAKPQEMTRAGFSAPETHALLWAGAADALVDLHSVVPSPWNASMARAIEVDADVVRIAGQVDEFILHGDVPSLGARQACVWQARRR
jgi:hypothetical protein